MDALPLKLYGSTNPFDEWWADEHGTGSLDLDTDVDECDEDSYDEEDEE